MIPNDLGIDTEKWAVNGPIAFAALVIVLEKKGIITFGEVNDAMGILSEQYRKIAEGK